MNKVIAFIQKYWPSILPAIVAVWGIYGTQVQHLVSSHPEVSAVVGALYAILAHLMPSPVSASKP